MEFQPIAAGGYVNTGPVATVVDESSELQGTQYEADLVNQLSSYRDFHLHTNYKVVKRAMNMRKWLGQT
jgi:hypothetical protein